MDHDIILITHVGGGWSGSNYEIKHGPYTEKTWQDTNLLLLYAVPFKALKVLNSRFFGGVNLNSRIIVIQRFTGC